MYDLDLSLYCFDFSVINMLVSSLPATIYFYSQKKTCHFAELYELFLQAQWNSEDFPINKFCLFE